MGSYPELRQDLQVSEQKVNGQSIFVVKDPDSNNFFSFIVFQYYVATLLDGNTSLETVTATVSHRMGRDVSVASITSFVTRLEAFGLLEGSIAQEQERTHRGLFYQKRLVDPQRALDWLYRHLAWVFTPLFLVTSLLWLLLSGWALLTDMDGYLSRAGSLLTLSGADLWSLYLLNVLIVTIHEFAHGLACRHFGGMVQDMGFLFIYFQSAFYTNVSDSYLFKRKRDRMIVMLAGMYSGLMIGATGMIVWRVTEPGSWLNSWSFLVVVASCWGLFFNLNPLIKLDGYYMLSDWLDIPNLRRKGIAYFKQGVRASLGFPVSVIRRTKPRERRIYLIYGTAASVYAVALITLFLVFTGETLLAYLPEVSLTGLLVVFAATFKPSVTETGSGESSLEQRQPFSIRKIPLRLAVWLFFLAGTFLMLILVKIDLQVAAPFRLRPVEQSVVRADVAGQIEAVYVEEGDTVASGQLLVQLATRDFAATSREVQAQASRAQAELRLLEKGSRPEEVEVAKAALTEARTTLEASHSQLARTEQLADQRVASQKELEHARTELAVRQAMVDQQESRLNLLRAGAQAEQIEAGQARIKELEATASYLQDQINRCRIVSPISGTVVTPFLKEYRGKFISQGDSVCVVVDDRRLVVEMAVPEREMEDIHSDYEVRFKLNGYPSSELAGTIMSIAPVATFEQGRPIVLIKSQIDNPSGVLKAGMTGLARINCGPRVVGSILLRRVIRYIRTEFWW